MNSNVLEKKLLDFGIDGQVVEVHPGPVITMYEFEPAPGVKLSRIVNLSDDLALALKSGSVHSSSSAWQIYSGYRSAKPVKGGCVS